ncbi:SDR family oxidoreductase [uncultured Phenylobacterium sp.]|uniref:SDR family NAD(P)-dependent oxidoreductase n=1 Tax=uncultured Phenylobacterium sp. TaxID=349273 RepID=UPI0025D55DF2|nr:SDR family oxidoreductase [uncultured Phenylobacterium sp.]
MTRKFALVTGASAGIGAAFARLLASHGYDVGLTARRADRLEALAEEIRRRYAVEALTLAADLARPEASAQILDHLAAQGRRVDVLINNAGYGVAGGYGEVAWPEHATFIQVMVTAPCELAHRVLPGMVERRFGRIVNVASLAGLIPGSPGAALYGASKAFLVKFSQALHLEVAADGVHVSALCPGMTYSEFHDVNGSREQMSATIPPWMWMNAEAVAAAGYAGMEANHAVCIPGGPNKAAAALVKLIPENLALALMGRGAPRRRAG